MQINPVNFAPTWKNSATQSIQKNVDTSQKYRIYNSTPEEILKKYNLHNITEKDFHQMLSELFLNRNEDSRKLGVTLLTNQLMENPDQQSAQGLNVVRFPKNGQSIDLLNAVWGQYKKEHSLGGDANDLLNLYNALSKYGK